VARKHRVEVDQGGKLNDSGSVVLALSNGISDSVIVLGGDKSTCLQALKRRRTVTKTDYIRLFSACLFLLLKPHLKRLANIVIDDEYTGHRQDIRDMLLAHIRRHVKRFPAERIQFARVGRSSPAHKLASQVRKKNRKAGRKITAERLLALVK
jgi:hypothetical protein